MDYKDFVWKTEDDKKIYYYIRERIGEEYEVVRYMISKGISSSHAHKIISKVKEYKE